MVPSTKSVRVFKRKLTQEERSVRGMLVTGLTKRDMAALDTFEGTVSVPRRFLLTLSGKRQIHFFKGYERAEVSVHPLEKFQDISAHLVNEERLSEHPCLPPPDEIGRAHV